MTSEGPFQPKVFYDSMCLQTVFVQEEAPRIKNSQSREWKLPEQPNVF